MLTGPGDAAPRQAPEGPASPVAGDASALRGDARGMRNIASRYRHAAGASLIEIRLASLDQLFNTLDPSPFHQKDLDADAEDYIVGAARELPMRESLKIVLHLPQEQTSAPGAAAAAGWIQGYFSYRRQTAARDLRFLFRQGRTSLAIGLAFLAGCLLLRKVLLGTEGTLPHVIAESLLIAGWVAMWRPLDTFLYDWWPLRGMGQVYAKLARVPVEIVAAGHTERILTEGRPNRDRSASRSGRS